MLVNLINQRQILVSPLPLYLINTNRLDARKILVITPPGDCPLLYYI